MNHVSFDLAKRLKEAGVEHNSWEKGDCYCMPLISDTPLWVTSHIPDKSDLWLPTSDQLKTLIHDKGYQIIESNSWHDNKDIYCEIHVECGDYPPVNSRAATEPDALALALLEIIKQEKPKEVEVDDIITLEQARELARLGYPHKAPRLDEMLQSIDGRGWLVNIEPRHAVGLVTPLGVDCNGETFYRNKEIFDAHDSRTLNAADALIWVYQQKVKTCGECDAMGKYQFEKRIFCSDDPLTQKFYPSIVFKLHRVSDTACLNFKEA